MRHRLLTMLIAALVLLAAAACAEAPDETDFRAWPGMTCYGLAADLNPGLEGHFQIDVPQSWYGDDYSEVYGVPTVLAMRDMDHVVMVAEIDLIQQVFIANDPDNPVGSFLQEGYEVVQGKDTEDSKILGTFDLHGLEAIRVEMVGQGFEMIWIRDGADLWFFMYSTDPDDADYTATVAAMVDSFTAYHPTSVGAAAVEDFDLTADDSGVTITGWHGSAAYVHIPAEIDGKPVVAVADGAFYESDVREVTFPDSVAALGRNVFGGCNDLASVTLPASLKVLPEGTFESCFRLSHVVMNEGLEKIEKLAFFGNSYLFILTLPDSLTELEDPNFVAMPVIGYFEVGEDCAGFMATDNGTVLLSKDGKRLIRYTGAEGEESYTVPEGVETIDQNAFYNAADLKEVILPESLREIGSLAFAMTGIKEITIPAGVSEIGFVRGYTDEEGNPAAGESTLGTDIAIRGYPGTAAEAHAGKFGLTFIPITEEAASGAGTQE